MTFKNHLISAIFITVISITLYANDAPKADEHGAPSGGSHGGTAEKPKTEIPEWVELQSRLMGIETQMLQKKVIIERLIEEKHHLKANSPAVKTIIEEMVTAHKELQKLIDDYEKESTIFKYRFPERGAKAGRTYAPVESKSLKEMEEELNIDGRLNRNMKKIRSQFKSSRPDSNTQKVELEKKNPPTVNGLQDPQKSSGESIIILEK